MKKNLLLFAVLVLSVTALMPAAAAGKTPGTTTSEIAPAPPPDEIPIVGTFMNGTFEGTLDVIYFTRRAGQIVAVGRVTGTLTDFAGNTVGSVMGSRAELPVSQIIGSCEILHLELGPLDLNLLGLVVHLDQVVLDISAEPGPGNLLGNLLCAITGLLDGPAGALALVTFLLNIVLAIAG